METIRKNWVHDFRVNEILHSISQDISGIYARLTINLPNHPEKNNWTEKSDYWAGYNRKIKDLVFDNEKQAQEEIDKLISENKQAIALESSLKT